MEHIDKGKIWVGNSRSKDDIPPDLSPITERAQKEKEQLAVMEKRQEEVYAAKRLEMQVQYETWLKDDTTLKQIEAHGIDWGEPGFIIEIFTADFSTQTKLLIDDDLYRKFTPFARILSASPYNNSPEFHGKKDWKVGDIIHLGDDMASVQVNPNWSTWVEGQKASAKLMGREPMKYIKKIYSLVFGGKLYNPDKSRQVLSNKHAIISEDSVRTYQGPWIFILDPYNVGSIKITGNPWA